MTIKRDTLLFESEGRENLAACLDAALSAAELETAAALIVFTAEGGGLVEAFRRILDRPTLRSFKLIGVTFPPTREFKDENGNVFTAGIPDTEPFTKLGIPVVAAHLPFTPVQNVSDAATSRSIPNEVLGLLGGGMPLCVQAIAMACDAGHVRPGDRVVAMSADTAIVARASSTEKLFDRENGILVEQVVCKPIRYTITRKVQTKKHDEQDPKQLGMAFKGRLAPPEPEEPKTD